MCQSGTQDRINARVILLNLGRFALLDRFLSSMDSGSILLLLFRTSHIYRFFFLIVVSQTVVLYLPDWTTFGQISCF